MNIDLSTEELLWLAKLESRLLQPSPPASVKARLVALGLAQVKLGSLVRTSAGDAVLQKAASR